MNHNPVNVLPGQGESLLSIVFEPSTILAFSWSVGGEDWRDKGSPGVVVGSFEVVSIDSMCGFSPFSELFKRRSTDFCDRKYRFGGFFSKMSDNEHPFPVLGYTEPLRIENLPLDPVAEFPQDLKDSSECFAVIMAEKSLTFSKSRKRGRLRFAILAIS
jgi:hypothetical protein